MQVRSKRIGWRWAKGAAVVGAAWLVLPVALAPAQQPYQPAQRLSGLRSVQDLSPRQVDELDRPRYRERQSHRGFEAMNDYINVVAETTQDDARRALTEAEKAWNEMGNLADFFAREHRRPDFGVAAVQVFIEREPARERDLPQTTIDVVGLKTHIHLYVGSGQPPLAEQLPRMQAAVAWALLHQAEYDTQLPEWASRGLAARVSEQLNPPQEALAADSPTAAPGRLGGDQWRRRRGEADRLEQPPEELAEAAAKVKFLLEAGDGAYAYTALGQFAASLRDSAPVRRPDLAITTRRDEVQPSQASDHLDQLFVRLEPVYAAWQKRPLAGQPVTPPLAEEPEIAAVQRDLIVALKLASRGTLGGENAPQGKVKVVSFAGAKPAATAESVPAAQAKGVPLRMSPAEIVRGLEDAESTPWATLDGEGRLLLSTNVARVEALLGENGLRFRRVNHDNRDALSARVPDGRELHAWLEENAEDNTRPLVRFAFKDLKSEGLQAAQTR